MSDEPYAQDTEQRERRPILGIILILLLLCLLLGGFFVIRNNLGNPLTPTEEPATSTATNTPTDTPTTESSEEATSPPTEPPTEPPPTDEKTCSETGRYCGCDGIGYSIVMCPDGSRTDTPVSKCTPDPTQCGGNTNTNDNTSCTELCCNNGGVQFTTQLCGCDGKLDQVTICMDGTKTDTILPDTCSPDPAQCQTDPKCSGEICDCVMYYTWVCKDSCGNVISQTATYCGSP